MAGDREVLKEVWEGKVPITFSLAPEELVAYEVPDDIHLLIPRITYFPLVTDKVVRSFRKFASATHALSDEEEVEIWLEYSGQPLKWHYPVGVLYDVYANSPVELPWKLIVHFENFPEEDILHCTGKECVESHYMYTLKEADTLKHKGNVINNMQKRDHKQLWSGLQNDKFDQFWSVNKKLMESGSVGSSVKPGGINVGTMPGAVNDGDPTGAGGAGFRYIPYRIYYKDNTYKQRPLMSFREDGAPMLFSDLLKCVDAEEFQSNCYRYMLHGIEIPMDTPVQWLSEHMSYPDNFLHICAVNIRPNS